MITKENTLSVTDFRRNAAKVVRKVKQGNSPLFIFKRSTPEVVVINLDYYNLLVEAYEDYCDSQLLLSVTDEEVKNAVPWEDFKKSLRRKNEDPHNK